MIDEKIKLRISEKMIQEIDKMPELATVNRFTAAASILQRAIRTGDVPFEQEAKIVLFGMIEKEFNSYDSDNFGEDKYEEYLLRLYFYYNG